MTFPTKQEYKHSYINRKRYKKRCIQGELNIPYGTSFECLENGMIVHNNKPICYCTSQDAYDYFCHNDDGKGMERGKLIDKILTISRDKKSHKYDRIWDMLWNDDYIRITYKRADHDDVWLWNFNFFNADIEELEKILQKIKKC